MKKIGVISMAFTFAGCLLGAGYVSGQELWLYFGSYGWVGIIGLVLAITFCGASSFIPLSVSNDIKTDSIDKILVRFDIPWLRVAVGVLFSLMYFVVGIVMVAGIAALGEQIIGLSRMVGSLIATAAIMVCVYFGVKGIVRIFSLTVPILIVAAIIISIVRIVTVGTSDISLVSTSENMLLGPWWLSAINYGAMNSIMSLGIITPVAKYLKKESIGLAGIAFGTFLLIIIAMLVIFALSTSHDSIGYDLPMLNMAQIMGNSFGIIYACLLFLAMFGNAVGTMFAAFNYMDHKFEKKNKLLRSVLAGVLVYAVSLTGFSNLIATVYPVFGYIGLASVILLVEHKIHNIHCKKCY